MGTLVQSANTFTSTFGTSTTLAYTSNVVANNLLVVTMAGYHDTVTFNIPTDTLGTSYTRAGSLLRSNVSSPFVILDCFYGIAPSSGANTVTETSSDSLNDRELRIWEVSGVATATPLDQTNGGIGGAGPALSGSITTTVAGFIIKTLQEWTQVSSHTPSAGTPTTGWTEVGDTTTGGDSAWRNETTTGTFDGGFNYSPSGNSWCCRIMAFADQPSGPFPPWRPREEPAPRRLGIPLVPIISYT